MKKYSFKIIDYYFTLTLTMAKHVCKKHCSSKDKSNIEHGTLCFRTIFILPFSTHLALRSHIETINAISKCIYLQLLE